MGDVVSQVAELFVSRNIGAVEKTLKTQKLEQSGEPEICNVSAWYIRLMWNSETPSVT